MSAGDVPTRLAISGPDDPRVLFLAESGYFLLALCRAGEALRVFEGLEVLLPGHHVGALGAAESLLELGDCRGAEARAHRASTLQGHRRPTLSWCFVVQARALGRCGELAASRRAFGYAARLDARGPSGREARLWLERIDQAERDARGARS